MVHVRLSLLFNSALHAARIFTRDRCIRDILRAHELPDMKDDDDICQKAMGVIITICIALVMLVGLTGVYLFTSQAEINQIVARECRPQQ